MIPRLHCFKRNRSTSTIYNPASKTNAGKGHKTDLKRRQKPKENKRHFSGEEDSRNRGTLVKYKSCDHLKIETISSSQHDILDSAGTNVKKEWSKTKIDIF